MRHGLSALAFCLLISFPAIVALSPTSVTVGDSRFTLLSNTEQCLVDCEAWVEWDARSEKANLYTSPDLFKVEFEKSYNSSGLTAWGAELWAQQQKYVNKFCPSTEKYEMPFADLNTGQACEDAKCVTLEKTCECSRASQEACGQELVEEWVKAGGSLFLKEIEAGSVYRIRIWGKREPTLNQEAVDWVPTLLGAKIADWAWWNASWDAKKAIQLPNQDINAGATIEVMVDFSAITVMSDLNDVRVVDENTDSELDRMFTPGSSSSSTDANMYFRLPNSLTAGDAARNTTYYMYYDNAAAGSPPDSNTAMTTACGWEGGEGCFLDQESGDTNSVLSKFGGMSYDIDPGETVTRISGLSGDPGDLNRSFDMNYSYWQYDQTGNAQGGMALIKENNKYICHIYMYSGEIHYNPGNVNLYDHAPQTWYRFEIYYPDEAAQCTYTVYDEEGNTLAVAKANPYEQTGEVYKYFFNNTQGVYHLDNLYQDRPTTAVGLGAEESNNSAPTADMQKIGGYDFNGGVPYFTPDSNLLLVFAVSDTENDRLALDINYSSTNVQGSGTVIAKDVNLTSAYCPVQDWATPSICSIWVDPAAMPDGNYYINMLLSDGATTGFGASDSNFGIDGTAPTLAPFTFSGLLRLGDKIDGTGKFSSTITEAIAISGCEYTVDNASWSAGTLASATCSSATISIVNGATYNFRMRATDTAGNLGTGALETFTGWDGLVDPENIENEDFIGAGNFFAYAVMVAAGGAATVIIMLVIAFVALKAATRG